jgi:hypothetical protein
MPQDYWDIDDPSFKLARSSGGAQGGGGGAGSGPPPPPPVGFSAPPVFSPHAVSGGFGERGLARRKLQQGMRSYMQSYEGGGEVMGGPPGVDTVDAQLNNGEGVLTTRAMSFPGLIELVNVLNSIAALGGDPTAAAEMPPAPGEEYGLGGLVRGIPGIGKPLSKAIDVAAPLALQGLGVPLPVGAGLTNLAMEGDPGDIGGSLAGATKAGALTAGAEALGARDMFKRMKFPDEEQVGAEGVWNEFADGGVVGQPQIHHWTWSRLKDLYKPGGYDESIDSMRSGESRLRSHVDEAQRRAKPQHLAGGGVVESRTELPPGKTGLRRPFGNAYEMFRRDQGPIGDMLHRADEGIRHRYAAAHMQPAHEPTGGKRRYAYGGYVSPQQQQPGIWGARPEEIAPKPLPQIPGHFEDDPMLGKLFDPRGNQFAMEAAKGNLTRRGQAQDRGDIAQLQSLGLQDPNLAASFLSGRQRERAQGQEEALAGVSTEQANRSQDFYAGQIDKQWQNYLDFIRYEREKQLKKTKGK